MPRDARQHDRCADQNAGGACGPDVGAECEDHDGNYQLNSGDAEQAADTADDKAGRECCRRTQNMIGGRTRCVAPAKTVSSARRIAIPISSRAMTRTMWCFGMRANVPAPTHAAMIPPASMATISPVKPETLVVCTSPRRAVADAASVARLWLSCVLLGRTVRAWLQYRRLTLRRAKAHRRRRASARYRPRFLGPSRQTRTGPDPPGR